MPSKPSNGDNSEARATKRVRSGSVEGERPEYNQAAIARVVRRVEVESIDLAGSFFWRRDEDAFPQPTADAAPEFGIDPHWWLSEDEASLSCVIGFAAFFDEDPPPYELMARYRVRYRLEQGDPLTDDDLTMFTSWNAVFNTWSYWREFVSSTLARAELPQIVVPVIRVPGWDRDLKAKQ